MASLDGKVALVTGASRGIGAATAKALAKEGAAVVLAARGLDDCARHAAEITEAGGKAVAIKCDVGSLADWQELVDETAEMFGRLDILVNNAGMIDPIGHLEDTDPEEWARAVQVNYIGVYYGIRTAFPHIKANDGVIINISSGAAEHPHEGWSAYCSTKAGVAMLTQMVAHENEGSGFRIFGFRPGLVDTEMQAIIRASGMNPISKTTPADHRQPEAPAQVIAWLCGPDAADLNGQELSMANDAWLRERAGVRE